MRRGGISVRGYEGILCCNLGAPCYSLSARESVLMNSSCYVDVQMSDVKRLPERLECMLFRARFEEELSELQPVSCM